MSDKTLPQTETPHTPTPGPWRFAGWLGSVGAYGVDSAEHGGIATCGGPPSSTESAANARLIAAAPELLAALEAMLDDAGYVAEVCPGDNLQTGIGMARAALAKARGS